eukprot:CCRYP_006898-RB/>CCRYP_006898-RB protein AED:0.05 eAED:0.05 QI:2166/0.8/0.66/1/0.6/0.16/6/373/438
MKRGISYDDSIRMMRDIVSTMASEFGDSLTISTVGLGNRNDEFRPLKEIAEAATAAGAKGSFERCERTAHSITSAISSLVTSTTETRLALQDGRHRGYTQRSDLVSEKEAIVKTQWKFYRIIEHFVYDPRMKRLWISPLLPLAVTHSSEAAKRRHNPPFLAINSNYLGKGAERVAFRCRLADSQSRSHFVFDDMVAKETKDVERFEEKRDFHEGFAQSQDFANYLAMQFNNHLKCIPSYSALETPQLRFVGCSVLMLEDPNFRNDVRYVLVEKMLDADRFRWTKWNDNNGMVDGKKKHMPIDVDFELRQLQKEEATNLGAIEEGDECSDDDSISDVETSSSGDEVGGYQTSTEINPSEYLQAFTHFTYRFTNKRVMVCDLQGRRMVYGRTDKGQTGMNAFFKTHKCTKICKYLELSAKNKKWQRDWRQDCAQGMNFNR